MDILVALNTGYFENGSVVMDRSKIIKNYFKNGILIDLAC